MPKELREEQSDKMFNFILDLIPKIKAEDNNRLIALRGKLLSFASSQKAKQTVLEWHQGKLETLKGHDLTIGQKWTVVAKSFTMQNLSLQEKEEIFETQAKEDTSDTSKNYRLMCDGLKANKEDFEKIYMSLKDKDNTMSITGKAYVGNGWNNALHSEWLLEYKERYFADILVASKELVGDHFEFFYQHLAPIDDDLDGQITEFEKINFNDPKLDKNQRDILKIVDNLKRRKNAYKLYQANPAL